MVVAPTRLPSPCSSPAIRRYPPARVLPGEAQDERDELPIDWRPAGVVSPVGPAPCCQPPVPAQQGLRSDDEARPALPGKQPRRRGQEDPIGVGEPGSGDLPVQHGHLVAQDDDLHVLSATGPQAQRHEFEQAARQDVEH